MKSTAMGQRARQGFVEKFDTGTMAPRLLEAFRGDSKATKLLFPFISI